MAGVPVDENVVAMLRAICPALPIPDVTSFPLRLCTCSVINAIALLYASVMGMFAMAVLSALRMRRIVSVGMLMAMLFFCKGSVFLFCVQIMLSWAFVHLCYLCCVACAVMIVFRGCRPICSQSFSPGEFGFPVCAGYCTIMLLFGESTCVRPLNQPMYISIPSVSADTISDAMRYSPHPLSLLFVFIIFCFLCLML